MKWSERVRDSNCADEDKGQAIAVHFRAVPEALQLGHIYAHHLFARFAAPAALTPGATDSN